MAVLVVAVSVVAVFILDWVYKGLKNKLAHLPGPRLSRWTGVANTYHWVGGQVPKYAHSLHQKYGPVVRIAPDEVSFADLGTFKEIHRAGGRYLKSDFYQKLVPEDVQSSFSIIDPQAHSERRRLLATPMADSSLKVLEPIVAGKVRLAITRVKDEMDERGVADVFQWWIFMATDIIGELTFGRSFGMLESKKKNQYTSDLELLAQTGIVRLTFPKLTKIASAIRLPFVAKLVDAGKRLSTYADESVDRYRTFIAENPSNPKPTLFTKLISDERYGMTATDMQHEAQNYIVAGSDTTAYTLTCLVYAVCKNPGVRDTLATELSTLPEGFTERDTRPLRYLDQVINEALRVYPSVGALPRRVPPEGAEFGGYPIPGGVTVSTQIYSLNRDEEIFPEPNTFDPARWENSTKRMKDALMTFGGGARVCLGIHLARMELRLATAHFFRAFPHARVSTREGMSDADMEMECGFLSSVKGHRCLVEE